MPRAKARLCSILMMMLITLPASFTAQEKDEDKDTNRAGAIRQDPGDMASLNLLYGAGGKEDAPNGPFTFV